MWATRSQPGEHDIDATVGLIRYPAGVSGGEAVFVPRSAGSTGEDWILPGLISAFLLFLWPLSLMKIIGHPFYQTSNPARPGRERGMPTLLPRVHLPLCRAPSSARSPCLLPSLASPLPLDLPTLPPLLPSPTALTNTRPHPPPPPTLPPAQARRRTTASCSSTRTTLARTPLTSLWV